MDAPDPPRLADPPAGDIGQALRVAATRAVLLAGALVVAGILFHQLVTLVAAGVITLILAIALSGFADPLERRGVPRPLGALIGLASLGGVVAGVLALVLPPLVAEVGRFIDDLPNIADSLAGRLSSLTGGDQEASGERIEKAISSVTDDPASLLGPVASFGLGAAGVISSLIVMVITAFYMAAKPQPLVDGALRLFPPRRRAWALHVMERIRSSWESWMKGVLVDMAVTGVLLYLGLLAIGLDYAILFAALSCLLVVVPYFGAIAGAFPPILLALADSPQLALLTLGVYLLVQQIEGNLIVPLIMARMLELHPAVIALGVVVVAQLFGVVGLFVAVPILSAIVIGVDELWVRPVEDDGRFRRILRGRPRRAERIEA